MKGESIGELALVLVEDDTVATAIDDLDPGTTLSYDGRSIEVAEPIDFGHKVALEPIDEGETVVKYGEVIGTATEPIEAGEWVHTHNCASNRGRGDAEVEV